MRAARGRAQPGRLAALAALAPGAVLLGLLVLLVGGAALAAQAPSASATLLLAVLLGAVALLGLWLLLTDRRKLFLLLLVGRAICDPALDALRSGAAGAADPGVGAVLNALMIVIAGLYLLHRPGVALAGVAGMWGAFLASALLSVALAPEAGSALRLFLVQVSYCAVFLVPLYLIKSPADVTACLHALLWSALLPVLYGLVELALGAGQLGDQEFRLKSTFPHANIFAFYLTLMGAVILHVQQAGPVRPGKALRWTLWLYLAVMLVLLVGTRTRSAWAGCLLIFAMYGLFFRRRMLLYLLLAPLLAMLVPAIRDRLLDLNSGNDLSGTDLNSYAWRLLLWQSGLGWMRPSHAVFGYGLNSFHYYSPQFFPLEGRDDWDPHNVYVQLFFETGGAGLLAYAWLFWRLLRRLAGGLRHDRAGTVIVLSTALAYLLVSYSDNMLYYLSFNWYFWFFMGTACAALTLRQHQAAAATPVARWPQPPARHAAPGYAPSVEPGRAAARPPAERRGRAHDGAAPADAPAGPLPGAPR